MRDSGIVTNKTSTRFQTDSQFLQRQAARHLNPTFRHEFHKILKSLAFGISAHQ